MISLDADKSFNKIQHPVIIDILEGLRTQMTYLNTVRAITSKPINIINQNGKKPKLFDKNQEQNNILSVFVQSILEFLARAIR